MNQTLPQMVVELAAGRRGETALRRKQEGSYRPISWDELEAGVRRFARSLLHLGLSRGDRIAIMAPNSPDWVWADLGSMAVGGITVPIYFTEGLEFVRHILKDSGSRLAFLHSAEMAHRILQHKGELPNLEYLVLLTGEIDHPLALSLEKALAGGDQVPAERLDETLAAGTGEETATLVYTSGTTGAPKGVRLTHRNILNNVEDCQQMFDIGPGDECLSFLPLSHVFERVDGYYYMLRRGVVISYAESIETVSLNLGEVRPSVMISVPRFYEKMYARILEQVQAGSWLRQKIFALAMRAGRTRARRELSGRRSGLALRMADGIAGRLVFAKLRARLGERLRYFISGGAPLNPDIAEFFLAAGVRIFEGYGLTESAGGIAVNTPQAYRLGTAGKPFPHTEVRVAGDGEILLRGPSIFEEYWQRPDETAEAFTDEGWFRTGDIGAIDQNGFLSITDRKKDIIVTASGENIAPQFLENQFKSDPLIDNALIFGDRKPYLTALLVPQMENLQTFARDRGIDFADPCDLVNQPKILQALRERLDGLQDNLASHQRVKRFTLLSGEFSPQEVTPTLKVRRNLVQDHYRQVLERMYQAKDHGFHDSGFCIVEELTTEERD